MKAGSFDSSFHVSAIILITIMMMMVMIMTMMMMTIIMMKMMVLIGLEVIPIRSMFLLFPSPH